MIVRKQLGQQHYRLVALKHNEAREQWWCNLVRVSETHRIEESCPLHEVQPIYDEDHLHLEVPTND